MATRKKKHSKHSKLNSKLYAILSGKSHRVVARTKKLATAQKRAQGLVNRGSKRVSIRKGSKFFPLARASKKRRSKRRSSKKRTSRKGKRRSKRRVSRRRTSKRRSSKRRSKRTSKRRSSRRRRSR